MLPAVPVASIVHSPREEHPVTPNRPEELTEYSLTELLTPPVQAEEPADFDEFWRGTFAEFGTGHVSWRLTRELETTETHRVTEIRFDSSAGEQAVAFLVVPHAEAALRRGLVIGHGYGGRAAPDLEQVPADAAAIFPAAPGTLPNTSSRFPALPDEHVLAGIEHRDTYSHRFAAADVWRAATVVLDAAPGAAAALDFSGGSFGGGVGALALPWDARFRRASLDVPSFGHHAIRLTRRCTGSGEAVRRYVQRHPEARQVLGYFDAAVAARRIRVPVHVAAAVLDPAVDPRGQFAVFHALTGPKRLTVRPNGHLDGPIAEVGERMARRAAADFFALPVDRLA
jgi:cephalosporin-C deacetylase